MKQSGIPEPVERIAQVLQGAGFDAYLVGGCVRDMLLKRIPKDWDIATNARPEEIQALFPEHVYENTFGTVGIKTGSDDPTLAIVEVTTFRVESGYSDRRRPDTVTFATSIEDDLSRRDFTVNALAVRLAAQGPNEIVDRFGGGGDIAAKNIRAVGNAVERFEEDALRLMRAVRFAVELGFAIEPETRAAITHRAGLLEAIAHERIRDELVKILMSPRAAQGIVLLEDLGLLRFIMPELRDGIGCGQNKHHIYTVFDHNVRALNYAVEKEYSFVVRLASLLHDVGKPRTKRGEGSDSTFYNHDTVGARMTARMLDRLHFPVDVIERVTHLVQHHLFYYNVGEVTESGVRRFLRRVGTDAIDDLLKVREADRIGSGVPKAFPYKLRHLLFMIDKVKHDPIHPKMLALRGDNLMQMLSIAPGPRVGRILAVLLEEVIDVPEKNEREALVVRARELNALSDADLIAFAEKARFKQEEFESGVESEMKERHNVS